MTNWRRGTNEKAPICMEARSWYCQYQSGSSLADSPEATCYHTQPKTIEVYPSEVTYRKPVDHSTTAWADCGHQRPRLNKSQGNVRPFGPAPRWFARTGHFHVTEVCASSRGMLSTFTALRCG